VDVARFDMVIDDSATIGVIATIRDLAKDGDLLTLRELSSVANDPNQVGALTKLRRDATDSPEVIDLNTAWIGW